MMKAEIPLLIYWRMSGFFSTALILGLFKLRRLGRIAGVLGTLAGGSGVISLMVLEKRLPLYGSLESIIYVSFLLTLLEMFASPGVMGASRHALTALTHGLICLPLLFQVKQHMAFNSDFFMYDNLWVNLLSNFMRVMCTKQARLPL